MESLDTILKNDEKAVLALRSLYGSYGYQQYKMSKFEEYDLYVKNKDFLISDSVITFTDTNGKLMALKPDVTLSIIKNGIDKKGEVEKVYYNENVYRVSKGTHSFKEIMQVGLECVGALDDYCIAEVVCLAVKSLSLISEDFTCDVADLGIISAILSKAQPDLDVKRAILSCIGEKNAHELSKICRENSVDETTEKALVKLVGLYGTPAKVMVELSELCDEETLAGLYRLVSVLDREGLSDKVNVDFSVADHTDYYNGIVFKGYINGVSAAVLSGGQYDRLMKKMGRSGKAIGFAVYLDLLERMGEGGSDYDLDAIILYGDSADAAMDAAKTMREKGESVRLCKALPEEIRARRVYKVENKEVKLLENNA